MFLGQDINSYARVIHTTQFQLWLLGKINKYGPLIKVIFDLYTKFSQILVQ